MDLRLYFANSLLETYTFEGRKKFLSNVGPFFFSFYFLIPTVISLLIPTSYASSNPFRIMSFPVSSIIHEYSLHQFFSFIKWVIDGLKSIKTHLIRLF